MRIMGAGVKGGTQIEEEAFPSPPLDVGADRSLTAPCRRTGNSSRPVIRAMLITGNPG